MRTTTNRASDNSGDTRGQASEKREAINGWSLRPTVSLIIPTRNEAANIEELIARAEQATARIPTDVVFVDDSTDETPEVISDVSPRCRLPVSLIHRPPERRGDGLGGAVTGGCVLAQGSGSA
jgi:cellulose synthase/poly-beta-1,6-N-acetylglucosamine synthase-like glycosyltransferase